MKLRPYQVEAVDAIRKRFRVDRSTLLVLPTGMGKTVILAEIARRLAESGHRTLVLAHRKDLVDQAAGTMRSFGLRVGIERGHHKVDPKDLPQVVVASVQTLSNKKRRERLLHDAFWLTQVDEAHHATSKSYRDIRTWFSTARLLGVTATPSRADGVALGNVFSSVAYRMSIADGIRQGWLAPLKLATVKVKSLRLKGVDRNKNEYVDADLARRIDNSRVLLEIAAPVVRLRGDRPTVVFLPGVEVAHHLADVFRELGVSAEAVDGSTPDDVRADVKRRLRDRTLEVVCNAQLWTEGFDLPDLSCVVVGRPCLGSQELLVQMIGRGTRLSEGKADCLVINVTSREGIDLLGPADALAGERLPENAHKLLEQKSASQPLDILDAVEQIQLEIDAEERAARKSAEEKMVQVNEAMWRDAVSCEFVAKHVDLSSGVVADKPASDEKIHELRELGVKVGPGLSDAQANALLKAVAKPGPRGPLFSQERSGSQALPAPRRGQPENRGQGHPDDRSRRVAADRAVAEARVRHHSAHGALTIGFSPAGLTPHCRSEKQQNATFCA